jgi:hypothetical protein
MFISGSSNTTVCFVCVSSCVNKIHNWETDDTTIGSASSGGTGPK